MKYEIKPLPPNTDLETKAVLKRLASAHRYLVELKGKSATIPNENILINTLALQEAKDSSAIENIITTHDELYKAQLFESLFSDAAAKEVNLYAEALKHGFNLVRKQKLITNNYILTIQKIIGQNDAGYRKLHGTALINDATGETVYTPPQDHQTITALMENLVAFINDEKMSDVDPLVKMALLHFQFESIHPFYDGNGRTGRILNILYLVQQGLLDLPILYLSRFIIQRKGDYYRLLQEVREKGNWEEWILYILEGVEQTSKETIEMISNIRELMQDFKHRFRKELPKIYSQDLLNNIFKHPYTKIEFVMEDLTIKRKTAAKYLDMLVEMKFMKKRKIGRTNFFINEQLYLLLRGKNTADKNVDQIKTINLIN
ncbi:MAG TPA: Fic family protein [Hanamia sp.]